MWPKEFEAEVYRVCIKYNLPNKDNDIPPMFSESIIFDSRLKFGEIREAICLKHNLDSSNVIFKRNSKSGLELKCLTDREYLLKLVK
jgi:hypothetical protein